MNTTIEQEPIHVRKLRPSDLDAVVSVDAKATGHRRDEYFKLKLAMAQNETGVEVSLASEVDGAFVGFLIARMFYGEFGIVEPEAVLEVLVVHPDFRRSGAAGAMLEQLTTNLLGLGVRKIATEVAWDDQEMLSFMHHAGFNPAARLCLELDCEAARRASEKLPE